MQSIERYGVVALLFLVVTVVAVLVWEGESVDGIGARVVEAKAPAEVHAQPATRRIKMTSPPVSQPLTRDVAGAQLVAEALPVSEPMSQGGGIVPGRGAGQHAQMDTNAGVAVSGAALAQQIADRTAAKAEAKKRRDAKRREDQRAAEAKIQLASSTYTIVAGDTLGAIASAKLGSVKRMPDILALNPKLNPDRLLVGQTIQLPTGGNTVANDVVAKSGKPARKSASKSKSKGNASTWVVGSGDSMWRVAEKALGNGERWTEIAKLNPKINANALRVGQVLTLPTGSAPAAATVAVAASTTNDEPRRGRVR